MKSDVESFVASNRRAMMIFKNKDALLGSARALETPLWSTVRLLVESDGVGLTVTDVIIKAGTDAPYGYDHHLEIAYCLEGAATLTDLATGEQHRVGPGFLWVCNRGERFRYQVHEATRLICVFNPALVGHEVNDETGSFAPST